MGNHTRYWNDDNSNTTSKNFDNDLVYSDGLELSQFSSKKITRAHQNQKKNQRRLIKKVYDQEGRQYKGDQEEGGIKENQRKGSTKEI